ncbi:uncharacterized protein LOC142606388 [Castanea sativa]|uniref:uncharacterized protein LOC142606388 n=1 Tax=Castanea sativa TaxID=21020 RepID=UPI003F64C9CC
MFNEIDGNFDDVAIRTFKVGLPAKHGLRKSLIGKTVKSMGQLMDHIDKYKRVEEHQQLGKGKAKVVPQDKWDFKSDKYNNNHPRRDFAKQSGTATAQVVNTRGQARSRAHRDASLRPPLGTISVILTAPGRTGSHPSRVLSITQPLIEYSSLEPKRSKMEVQPALSFSNEEKVGTTQPHNDALVVTLRIGSYDVNKLLVDQGSNAKIMYPDFYKGLKLKLEDSACYDSPLVGFDGKVIVLMG